MIEVLGQNAGNEVWTGIVNVSALSLAHNPTDGVIAIGHNQGAAIYSTVFESIIYSISTGPVDALAFDAEGKSIICEKGELVCATPFPSMPIYFWNDYD